MANQLTWLRETESRVLEFLKTATPDDVINKIADYNKQIKHVVTEENKDSWKFDNVKIDSKLEAELNLEANPSAAHKPLSCSRIRTAIDIEMSKLILRHGIIASHEHVKGLTDMIESNPDLVYEILQKIITSSFEPVPAYGMPCSPINVLSGDEVQQAQRSLVAAG